MGPEQINILDQYINTKTESDKQNGSNIVRNLKAGSFSMKLNSLDTSICVDQNLKSEEESPDLNSNNNQISKIKETYFKAKTFVSYENKVNRKLIEVPIITQTVNQTPNHSINPGVIRLKQSDIQPGILNQSRLSSQY